MSELKDIEEKIYQKSLSYEYFWRNLVSYLLESKVEDNYWHDRAR